MSTASPHATCALCGTSERCPPDGLPPGWTLQATAGRIERVCATCARRNLRAIEGKLDQEWWE